VQREWTIRGGADIGRTIADIRAASSMTQQELAETAGVSRDYIAQIESGRSSRILDHMVRILRRLGATVTVTFDVPDGDAEAEQ
jgi:transcriptional regulator with XRE-family HTH domain